MKRLFTVACLAACGLGAFAGDGKFACPRWLSVMQLHEAYAEQLAADVADLGNNTFVDGIAWSCPVMPEGDPVTDRAAVFADLYRKIAPLIRCKSPVAQGILLQSTMGHRLAPGTPTPWQLAVKPDGTSVYRMCPMDERFLAYIAKACRTFATAKPDFFMIDDDTRLIWPDGVPGCFCPLHLAEFSKRTGRNWTRTEVAAMLAKGASREAEIWLEVKVDSLRRLFRTIRENFGDDIPGMLCCAWRSPHKEHGREFAKILAAPGQTPIIRGTGAPYWDSKDIFHVVDMRGYYAAQLAEAGRDVVFLQEGDTCPHTLWATSAVRTFDHLAMLALEGCKGAKIWITRNSNYHEQKSALAYRRVFRENKGLMEWVAKVNFSQRGVVVPLCGPQKLNFGDRYLALVGIPYRYGKARPGEITALTAETLALLPRAELEEILSGKVIVDGAAALWLSENGYSSDIGVNAKPWNRKTIQLHEFSDGSRQSGVYTVEIADLTDMDGNAKIVTKLLNKPRLGVDPVFEAPGCILFKNGRGGTVLAFAQPLPVRIPRYFAAAFFSESYKAEVIRWLMMLGGEMPGGVCYLGVGHVTCESGVTDEGEKLVVLNVLDIDGDDAPELAFAEPPTSIERLQGNGEWAPVKFERAADGVCRLDSPILTQRPAIFRWQ